MAEHISTEGVQMPARYKENLFELCLTAISPWSYCSLKFQVLRLSRVRSSKTVECRFSLKRQKQPPEVFCKNRWKFANSQKKTCVRASFLKKKLYHRCFPVNFAKFIRAPFLQNTSWQLLLTRTWHNNNIKLLLILPL